MAHQCKNFASALVLALAAAAVTPAAPAMAESQADRDACTPDVFRLCSAYIPSESRIVACLNSKASELSPGCRAVIKGGERTARPRERRRTAEQ